MRLGLQFTKTDRFERNDGIAIFSNRMHIHKPGTK